jgi:hypothetical protein
VTFLLNLNWTGSLGASVSRTSVLPAVYSLIVPVISAPVLGSGLLLVGWAESKEALNRRQQRKQRKDLVVLIIYMLFGC